MTEAAPAETIRAFRAAPFPIPLACGVQPYGWGERGPDALIPRLLGAPPEPGKAYAELWIGDHPSLPATALLPGGEVPLPALIASAPEAVLGRPGGRLPFLMKVLAAARSLSIQAHPDRRQAEAGFAREEAAGLPLQDPRRSYKDPNPKPELLIALTPFWGLKGFRPLEEIASAFDREAPELKPLMPDFRERLSRAADRRELLKDLYGRCFSLPQKDVNALLSPLLVRLRASGPFPDGARESWVLQADADYSRGEDRDRGLFSLYLLN
jgi:mannose-6-phosphate isomerase